MTIQEFLSIIWVILYYISWGLYIPPIIIFSFRERGAFTSLLICCLVLIITAIIEALILYKSIPTISFSKSCIVSFIAKTTSMALETALITSLIVVSYLYFDATWVVNVDHNLMLYFIFRYIISVLIELGIIKIIFGYEIKQLILSVFGSNLITYLVAVLKIWTIVR